MLVRWNDFGLGNLNRTFLTLGELRNEMEKAFVDFDRGFGQRRVWADASVGPRAELSDSGEALVVKAAVPGIDEKELEITLEGKALTIRGKREEVKMDDFATLRKERSAYEFSRAFSLPCQVDADNVTASLKDGILELTMPKVPEAKPRQITIGTN